MSAALIDSVKTLRQLRLLRISILAAMIGLGQIAFGQNGDISSEKGVVVQEVAKGSEAQAAGFQPGDILLIWKRGNSRGELETPFDVDFMQTEQGSRGEVEIEGTRLGIKRSWRWASDWPISVRPNLRGSLLSIYEEACNLENSQRFESSVELWAKASAVAKKSGVTWLSSWFLMRGASAAFSARLWDRSNELYHEATAQAKDAGPNIIASIFDEWGNSLSHRNDPAGATKYYLNAVDEWRNLGRETLSLSLDLSRLGIMAALQGEPNQARDYYRQALAVAQRVAPKSRYVAGEYEDLGVDALLRGDFASANRYLHQALTLEEELFPHEKIAGWTLFKLGTLSSKLGDPVQANAYYRRALAVSEKEYPNSYYLAWMLDELAFCALERGDQRDAQSYAQRAMKISQNMPWGGATMAESMLALGRVTQARGDLAKAREYYQGGVSIAQKSNSRIEIGRLAVASGNFARKQGEYEKAEEYYQQALTATQSTGPESSDHEEAVAGLASVLRQEGRLDEAAEKYEEVLSTFENQAVRVGGSFEVLSGFRARHAEYYTEYSDLLVTQRQTEHAFEVLERSRAQTLLDMLASAQIDVHRGVEPALIEKERDLKQEISAKSNALLQSAGDHTQADLAAHNKRIAELLAQYQDIKGQIRASSPDYAALTQPKSLTVHEIRELLDPDTILLEYSLGDERSYVWLVTRDSIAPYPLRKRAVIEELARRVNRLLATRNRLEPNETFSQAAERQKRVDREYTEAAADLSQMILGPVANLLGQKRLAIVSDGVLHSISFGALPMPQAPGLDSQEKHEMSPLVLEHEIVNLPSASLVAELRREEQGRQEPSKQVAVLADPVFDKNDGRVNSRMPARSSGESATRRVQSKPAGGILRRAQSLDRPLTRSLTDLGLAREGRVSLVRLLATRDEADAIVTAVPSGQSMKALDFRASRATASSPELAQYRVVHFATHGLLNSEHPELSGLVLSMVDQQGKPQNGFLQLEDIYNLNLPVDLVVLSACETGLGKEISGEGIVGLTRGFMYAGAPRVVASLWDVNDEATAVLMANFYRAMERDKMRPAAALRAAQIQMWKAKRWRSPYYWAAFQIQGEWN